VQLGSRTLPRALTLIGKGKAEEVQHGVLPIWTPSEPRIASHLHARGIDTRSEWVPFLPSATPE
jgi:hypothetical protein